MLKVALCSLHVLNSIVSADPNEIQAKLRNFACKKHLR